MHKLTLAAVAALLVTACGGSGSSSSSGSTTSGGSSTSSTTTTGGSSSSSTTNGSGSTSGGSSTTSSTSSGGSTGSACADTTPVTRLPTCGAAATTAVNIPSGCAPTVDGTLHLEEWNGATCFNVGSNGDVVYAKYAGDALYLAFSASPVCACGMSFSFDPDGNTTLDNDEFSVNVFDDPFNANGDRSDYVVQGGTWNAGTAPAGIVTACPGNQPSPINYEFKIPFSALGITAGTAHTFRFAVNHPNGGFWPANLALNGGSTLPYDPSTWGTLSSPSNWQ